MNSNSGILAQVSSWIEYPFKDENGFPWKSFLLVAAIVVILIFFMHDGSKIMADTVGEIV